MSLQLVTRQCNVRRDTSLSVDWDICYDGFLASHHSESDNNHCTLLRKSLLELVI
jgi:hypothetical protein